MRFGSYIARKRPEFLVDGKIDVKRALNALAEEIKEYNEAPSSEKDGPVDTSRIYPVFHSILDQFNTNRMDIKTLMTLAVQKLNVPFAQWKEEESLMRRAISQDSASEDPTFYSTARAIGDVIRLKNGKGKPTGEEKPEPPPFEPGKAKGKAVPRYGEYRWTEKFKDAGIASRLMFDDMIDWIGGRAPTVNDAKKYVEHLNKGASVPDMGEEEEETQEPEPSPIPKGVVGTVNLPAGYSEVSNRKRG